jgi:hypothetical protein
MRFLRFPRLVVLGAVIAFSGSVNAAASRSTASGLLPERRCERITVYTNQGKKTALAPPAPGLTAVAVSPRRVRVLWRFSVLPRACKPDEVAVGIVRKNDDFATPRVLTVKVTRKSGTVVIHYPNFLPRPNEAFASAYGAAPLRYRSRTRLISVKPPPAR